MEGLWETSCPSHCRSHVFWFHAHGVTLVRGGLHRSQLWFGSTLVFQLGALGRTVASRRSRPGRPCRAFTKQNAPSGLQFPDTPTGLALPWLFSLPVGVSTRVSHECQWETTCHLAPSVVALLLNIASARFRPGLMEGLWARTCPLAPSATCLFC